MFIIVSLHNVIYNDVHKLLILYFSKYIYSKILILCIKVLNETINEFVDFFILYHTYIVYY